MAQRVSLALEPNARRHGMGVKTCRPDAFHVPLMCGLCSRSPSPEGRREKRRPWPPYANSILFSSASLCICPSPVAC